MRYISIIIMLFLFPYTAHSVDVILHNVPAQVLFQSGWLRY